MIKIQNQDWNQDFWDLMDFRMRMQCREAPIRYIVIAKNEAIPDYAERICNA